MRKLVPLLIFIAASSLSASGGSADVKPNVSGRKIPFNMYSNEIVVRWNTIAFETMQGPAYNPLLASRIMAMVNLAMHDALNAITPVYETYAFQKQDKKANPVAAVSAAAHAVLLTSFPDRKELLDIALVEALKSVKPGNGRVRGIALGAEVANAILELRKNDGAFADPIGQVNNPNEPGLYQAVPPMPILYAPFWTTMKTFGIETPSQFRVEPMPALTSSAYAIDFNEVKQKGAKENSTRSDEQTFIAKFWYEFSEIGWNRIAVNVARDKKLDLSSTARLLALVSMGLADSYTAGWDSKFHYNFWRPFTAIRAASTDLNDETVENATWDPLLVTPPVHDYPSTHSVLGSAAATVLGAILGDETKFKTYSPSAEPANSTRTFERFSQAAIENGDSRVYAGIHFRFSCNAGLGQGKKIGEWIVNHKLKPLPAGI